MAVAGSEAHAGWFATSKTDRVVNTQICFWIMLNNTMASVGKEVLLKLATF